ncbi:MAG: geranylgeranyl reductase family protein [Dehalococcoidia bacterium]
MTTKNYDVIVVGAGPAGSCAALELANGGVGVALLDKEEFPRYKTCAGGIVRRAIANIPVDMSSVIDNECFTVEFNLLAPALHFSIWRNQPIISMTSRDNFDNLLAMEAEKAGAKMFSRCEVFDVHQNSGSVVLQTNEGDFSANFVIAADGALSRVARKGGWQETRRLIPALECRIHVDDKTLEKFGQTARFDFDLVTDGYAWTFPKRDHLSVGIGRMGGRSIKLLDSFHRYLKLSGIAPLAEPQLHRSVIPVSPRKDGLMRNRIILAGDAAGLVDPITAEGISFAVLSSQIAAEALISGELKNDLVENLYNHEINERVLKELRLGRIAGNLLYNHPRVRSRLFGWYGHKLTKTMTRVFMGETTYGEIARNPLNYVKLMRIWNPADTEVE